MVFREFVKGVHEREGVKRGVFDEEHQMETVFGDIARVISECTCASGQCIYGCSPEQNGSSGDVGYERSML